LLDIKPVFEFRAGEAIPVARTRTRRRAVDRIVEDTVSGAADRPMHLAVIHASAEDEAAELSERLAARTQVVERVVVAATPVIGAHTGPGLLGTAFFCDGTGSAGRR
jgi:fatty acid-binding protein DegV